MSAAQSGGPASDWPAALCRLASTFDLGLGCLKGAGKEAGKLQIA